MEQLPKFNSENEDLTSPLVGAHFKIKAEQIVQCVPILCNQGELYNEISMYI